MEIATGKKEEQSDQPKSYTPDPQSSSQIHPSTQIPPYVCL